ncbi:MULTISPECIES: hypothetical protein [unclassified Streptomyces]|uniref:hypothetical protein n=1 Tax=unclassified Streptomyces TaxID=2593676 RepID=UPI00136DDC07|nr:MULTISPECIES: hypothetical protein [unclassified Streptomyces]MCW5249086.1 hypothetical protein [Streptomyces sp. SHP 1-2]MYU21334.1 hypothetical protein [Streptomyces sp. SID8352]
MSGGKRNPVVVPPENDDAADVAMPWAPRDRVWSGSKAESRARAWADGDPVRLASVFLYRRPGGNPATEADYKFPVADIVDGRPERVLHAVHAAAGRLDRAAIPEEARRRVKERLTRLYHSAAEAFDDPAIKPPWE